MWALALDTTTSGGSSALLRDGAIVHEAAADPTRSHAERVPADLMALLDRERLGLGEIEVFAVGAGPGSFTGLRVGIAAMQGLACAVGKPLVGVSTLDALAAIVARADPGAARIATWVDAWRGEVYAASYAGAAEVDSPTVERPEHVLTRLGEGSVTFVGDGAGTYEALIRSTRGVRARVWTPVRPLLAGMIGTLATAQVRAGHRPGADAIRPLYVRRPDAELTRQGTRAVSSCPGSSTPARTIRTPGTPATGA
jgi:tRNA threonylcarbamoyladenosine biosynthesis protein TsaB